MNQGTQRVKCLAENSNGQNWVVEASINALLKGAPFLAIHLAVIIVWRFTNRSDTSVALNEGLLGLPPLHCEALCALLIYTSCCAFSSLLPYSFFKFSLCRAHILKAFSTPSLWSPSLLRAPVSFSFFLLALFSFHTIVIVILGIIFFRTMGYSYILSSEASLATFRAVYGIPEDVDIAYYHQGDIEIQRRRGTNTVFFPLMSILEGGIRFSVDPLVIGTLRFYGLCPDQLPPNFFWVVSCVSKLNQLFGLQLDHHDINFMYR